MTLKSDFFRNAKRQRELNCLTLKKRQRTGSWSSNTDDCGPFYLEIHCPPSPALNSVSPSFVSCKFPFFVQKSSHFPLPPVVWGDGWMDVTNTTDLSLIHLLGRQAHWLSWGKVTERNIWLAERRGRGDRGVGCLESEADEQGGGGRGGEGGGGGGGGSINWLLKRFKHSDWTLSFILTVAGMKTHWGDRADSISSKWTWCGWTSLTGVKILFLGGFIIRITKQKSPMRHSV